MIAKYKDVCLIFSCLHVSTSVRETCVYVFVIMYLFWAGIVEVFSVSAFVGHNVNATTYEDLAMCFTGFYFSKIVCI